MEKDFDDGGYGIVNMGVEIRKIFKQYFNNYKRARDHNYLSGEYVASAR